MQLSLQFEMWPECDLGKHGAGDSPPRPPTHLEWGVRSAIRPENARQRENARNGKNVHEIPRKTLLNCTITVPFFTFSVEGKP